MFIDGLKRGKSTCLLLCIIIFFFSFLLLRFCIKYFSISFRWFSFFYDRRKSFGGIRNLFPVFHVQKSLIGKSSDEQYKKTNNHKRKLIFLSNREKRVQKEFNSPFQKEIKTVSRWYSWILLAFCVIFHPSSLFT